MPDVIGGVQTVTINFASDVLPLDLDVPLVSKGKIADRATVIIDNDELTGGDASTDIGLEVKLVDVIGDTDANAADVTFQDFVGGGRDSSISIAVLATQVAKKIIRKIVTSDLESDSNFTSVLRLRIVLTAGIVYTAGIIRFRVIPIG